MLLTPANPRRISTSLANRLWGRLRHGQVAGHHFSRQYPVGRYIADFYCGQAGVIVQIDPAGGGGTDARADHFELDGHRVVRVSEHELIDDMDAAVRKIGDALRVAPLDRVTARPPRFLY